MMHRGEFENFMGTVFAIYEKPIKNETLNFWFEDLKEFELSEIKYAFSKYRKLPRKGEFMPKTASAIISIIEDMKEWKAKQSKEITIRKSCDFTACENNGVEPFVEKNPGEKVLWLCRKHGDKFIVDHFPDSPQAYCLLGTKEFEAKANATGMTNRQLGEHAGFVKNLEKLRTGLTQREKGRPNNFFEFERQRHDKNDAESRFSR